ncbi:MAG: 1-acyl-sn-glycerol-3-phosphate acyltransferase [Spirochaetota bacterium]|jgi:1-acyl-sn-glycerol-3-phosphate acyltransferase|nr:1-acyl-sn-glycerol-3-phosphate acyltransferase [Spirochaetota bacterium]NMA56943.1 1-acyl-sn-glycerol-3-phosphate acyltransferase [Treponema sp.]HPM06005.1 1-acyl-sn-glycerol-3-phosphate acyltransferase [Treponemataceae bacterium]
MKGIPLGERYKHLFGALQAKTKAPAVITEENVFQKGNDAILPIVDGMLDENFLEGSRLEGLEHFENFLNLVKEGKRGLILMEHYSNLDLPALIYLLRKDAGAMGEDLAKRIVAIAGMKLNEEDPMVRAWAEAFSRIVIYPSRSLSSIKDPEKYAEEEAKSKKINMASMRALDASRKRGEVTLVFPSGTRYRPGKPETKRGVREIDSYLRLSDVMILVTINGSCLRINEEDPNNMLSDLVIPDCVVLSSSPVFECKAFRNEVINAVNDPEVDKKQAVVDRVMDLLNEQHEEIEKIRFR